MIVPSTFHIKTKLCKLKESRPMKGKPNVGELLSSEVNLFSMCLHVHTYNGGYNVPKYMYNYTKFIKIKFTYDGRDESQSDCYLS